MEKRTPSAGGPGRNAAPGRGNAARSKEQKQTTARPRKLTEYGRQLQEKQKVKDTYGMREKQFRRFFAMALRSQEATGDKLLTLLERRLDNVVYRLKLASTRRQARQVIVHGHIFVNSKKCYAPSYIVSVDDEVALAPKSTEKAGLLGQVVDKRLNSGVKVPEWLESDKKGRKGRILRDPVRSDIQMEVDLSSIVEFYSK